MVDDGELPKLAWYFDRKVGRANKQSNFLDINVTTLPIGCNGVTNP